ncbi:MAG: hypothetical protein ACI837_000520 [Crocinitomicaceae bacterium]|jgi:hypothetical protein
MSSLSLCALALYFLYPAWNLNNCAIIAYIRDTTNHEIVQVAKMYLESIVATHSEDELPTITIHPNPTSDLLFINRTGGLNGTKTWVTDYLGKIVISSRMLTLHQEEIDLSALANGTYLLFVESEEGLVHSEKVVKF